MARPPDEFWRGRRVLVTGHTGFKGGWLTLWLHRLGARVHGYALDPPTTPSLFEAAGLAPLLETDVRADLGDLPRLMGALRQAAPEVVFHLAAQSLVRPAYREPLETLQTNVMGTAHLLEAVRGCPSVRAVVVVTTDKVYENREWVFPYRENDPLGGRDPYSAGKAAAELVTASYRDSFFSADPQAPRVASARAGNVVGGGDWAPERLVPDCLRAFGEGRPVSLRFPGAVRPWQHVLEPLSGYLRLAERLCAPKGSALATAWNFGPGGDGDATVGEVADTVARLWGDGEVRCGTGREPHEAGMLRLDATQARARLGWRPRWSLERALAETVHWHRAWLSGTADMRRVSQDQIEGYGVLP